MCVCVCDTKDRSTYLRSENPDVQYVNTIAVYNNYSPCHTHMYILSVISLLHMYMYIYMGRFIIRSTLCIHSDVPVPHGLCCTTHQQWSRHLVTDVGLSAGS